MDSYRAEDIIQQRQRRRNAERATDVDRKREIAYYFIYATIPAAALKLEKRNFPTDGSTYQNVNQNLILPGDPRPRTGWFLATFTGRGSTWNLYILQGGVLVAQNAHQPHNTRIIPRRLRRHVRAIEDLTNILTRLRSLAGVLVSDPLKLRWVDYPGFWFCDY